MSKKKSLAALNALSRGGRTPEEAIAKIRSKHTGDVAYEVMSFASLMEHYLEIAIKSHFVDLDSVDARLLFDDGLNAPLSTLSAKLRIALALGVIDKQSYADLDRARRIRNAFAHSIDRLSFDLPEVAAVCLEIPMIKDASELQPPLPLEGLFNSFVCFWILRFARALKVKPLRFSDYVPMENPQS